MVMLDASIVNTALPSIQRALDSGFSQLQWVIDAYTLAFAVLLLASGAFADRFGRKRVFQVGLVVFSAGSLLCGLAVGPATLDAARALQGVGGAALAPASMAVLAASFTDNRQRIHAISLWASLSAIGLALGPTLGGALVEWAGWRWVFFINVPVGAVCLAWAQRSLRDSRDPSARRLDPAGLVLSTLWLGALTYGFIERGTHDWASAEVAAPLAAAAALFAVFVAVEARVGEPMLPLGLFRRRVFAVTAVVTFLVGFVLLATPFLTVQYLQNVKHFSALPAGLRMLAFSAMFSVFAPIAGRLSRRFSPRVPITLGACLSALGFAFLSAISPATSYPDLAWRLLLAGTGFGLMMSPLAAAALAGVSHERTGLGSSVANTTRQAGVVVGIAVLGALVQSRAASAAQSALAGRGVPGSAALAAALGHGGAQLTATQGILASDPLLASVAATSYVTGLTTAFVVQGAIMAICAVLSALLLRAPRPES